MTISLRLQGMHITFQKDDVMLGDSRLALLADVHEVVTIDPHSHARIATPIAFTGDGKTIALIDMHAGRLSHALGLDEEILSAQGEYFLPAPGVEAVVHVDVINETGATMMIRPNTQLGILTFINLTADAEVAPAAEPTSLDMTVRFEPLFLPALDVPAYADGSSAIVLKADVKDSMSIAPHTSIVVPTGLSVRIPAGHEGQLRAAADLPSSLTVQNRAIESSNDTLVNVVISNGSDEPATINPADVIAQLVVTPVSRPILIFPANDTRHGENRLGAGR